ncbi:MAG: histidine--tRNA ligase [Candidatus Nomurabacteria bacterium]|nr:MAG: histidine--tRNA ligase [Candidatus Nomurabacteria bacterium]
MSKEVKDTAEQAAPKRSNQPKTPTLVRGMKDILPSEQGYWRLVEETVRQVAMEYRYEQIETPVLEPAALFNRTIGKETDVLEKEMYTFTDRSNESLALRPEGTAGVARAYLEHGMLNQPQPVKVFYIESFFRHDRPQAGRYRQFFQFGFEAIGDAHPVVDAQIISMTYEVFRRLQVPVNVHMNSLGDKESRAAYEKALLDYYKSHKSELCEDCLRRMQKNPLRLLDCKQTGCRTLAETAPQTVDHLNTESREHFVSVLEYLDELEIPYTLDPRIVRGLDYYSKTAFEFLPVLSEGDDRVIELGGGGRYDGLIEQIGGRATPAVGAACGIERLINRLHEQGVQAQALPDADVFLAQLGDPARKLSIKLFGELSAQGVRVAESLSKDGIKPQLEAANRVNAKYTLILGQKEMMDGTILIRDMENGIQEVVDMQKIVNEVVKRLQRGKSQQLQAADPEVVAKMEEESGVSEAQQKLDL